MFIDKSQVFICKLVGPYKVDPLPVSLRLTAATAVKTNLDISVRVPPKQNITCSRTFTETS